MSSGRVVLFRCSAARGQIFPPIERGKKTASGGERRQQTHKRERGAFGEEPPGPPMLGVPFRKNAPLGKLRILSNFDKQPSFPK